MLFALRDTRFALRSLAKDKSFSLTVALTLALCIAANTATFAIVHSVLLKPLGIPEADRILLMANEYPKAGAADSRNSGAPDYYDRLRDVSVFEQQAMFRYADLTIETGGVPQKIRSMTGTPSLFRLLRVSPVLGRSFTEEEGELGGDQKVLLSYGLWREMYAGSRDVLGKELRLDGRPYTIVGVMPAGFKFLDPEVRLWTPLAFTVEQKNARHSNGWFNIGRLKPGATLQQAQIQVDALNRANLERFPQFRELLINAGFHTEVLPLIDLLVRDVRPTLWLLWGGAVFVLLIGALNIANLALARIVRRRKEFATRLALGAGRAQIARQMIVENLLLCGIGGLAGIGLGALLIRSLTSVGLKQLPRIDEVRIDGVVAAVAMALALAVGIAIAVAAFGNILRIPLQQAFRDETRGGSAGRASRRIRHALVVAQIAFAFVLLAGAGLLLASFRQLLSVDPGFRIDGITTASISAPRAKYGTDAQLRELADRALHEFRAIPGVTAVGATTTIPFGGEHSDSVIFAEGYVMKPGESVISPRVMVITPGYFEAMGMKMVSGRTFDQRDTGSSTQVIIVDERLANRFWPGRNPIGRRMYRPQDINNLLKTDEHTKWLTVVGVVRNVRLDDLAVDSTPVGAYYYPDAQDPDRDLTFAIQSPLGLGAINGAVHAAMSRVDPELAVFDIKTMQDRAATSMSTRRASMSLSLGFAGLALFLAAIGIYGVLTYLVTERRREIGIRTALGCPAAGIVRVVLAEGLLLVAIGLVGGFAGAIGLQRVIQSELFGVRPLDPAVMAIVVAVLALVAVTASLFPARRAVRVDPMIVLNEQ